MKTRAVLLLLASLASLPPITSAQPALPFALASFSCSSVVAKSLYAQLARQLPQVRTAVLSCQSAVTEVKKWLGDGANPAVVIADQTIAASLLPQISSLSAWRSELAAQRLLFVAAMPPGSALSISPNVWLGTRRAIRVSYVRGTIDVGAVDIVRTELGGIRVDVPRTVSSVTALATLLTPGAKDGIDLAILPADDGGGLYTELQNNLPRLAIVALRDDKWSSPLRFTIAGGAAYTALAGVQRTQPPDYGLLRAERQRGGVAIERHSFGDRYIASLFREAIQVRALATEHEITLTFPLILTNRPQRLDASLEFARALAAGYVLAAFNVAVLGGHQCSADGLVVAYTSYFLNAYLTSPTETNFCNLWSQYELASREIPYPFGERANALAASRKAMALDVANACKAHFLKQVATPVQDVACNPPVEREYANQRRTGYVHALALVAEGLFTEAVRAQRFAEARSCLADELRSDGRVECRAISRANWLTFYDPFLPLGLLTAQPGK